MTLWCISQKIYIGKRQTINISVPSRFSPPSETPFLREDGEKGAWALIIGEIVGGAYTDIPKGTKALCEVPYFPSENKMEPYIIMSLVGYPSMKKVFDDENMIVLGGAPFYDVYGSSLSELIRSGFHVPDEWQKLNQSITGAN